MIVLNLLVPLIWLINANYNYFSCVKTKEWDWQCNPEKNCECNNVTEILKDVTIYFILFLQIVSALVLFDALRRIRLALK